MSETHPSPSEQEYSATDEGIDQVARYFSGQMSDPKRTKSLEVIRKSSQDLLRLSPEQMEQIARFSEILNISRVDLLTQVLLLKVGLGLEQMNKGQLTHNERSQALAYPAKSILVSERPQDIIDQGQINSNEVATLLGLNPEQAQQLLMYRLDTPKSHIETQALQDYEGKIVGGNSQRVIDGADMRQVDSLWDPMTTIKTVGYRFLKDSGRSDEHYKPVYEPIGDIVLPEGRRTLPFLSLALATTKALYQTSLGTT